MVALSDATCEVVKFETWAPVMPDPNLLPRAATPAVVRAATLVLLTPLHALAAMDANCVVVKEVRLPRLPTLVALMLEIAVALKLLAGATSAATWLALAPVPKFEPRDATDPAFKPAIAAVLKPAHADAETAEIWVEVNAATCEVPIDANCLAEICDTCFAVRLATPVVLILGRVTKFAPDTQEGGRTLLTAM